MASFLSWVLFQGLGAYLLQKELKWAGRVGEPRMCMKVLASMGVGAVGGLGGWSGNWSGASGSSIPTLM